MHIIYKSCLLAPVIICLLGYLCGCSNKLQLKDGQEFSGVVEKIDTVSALKTQYIGSISAPLNKIVMVSFRIRENDMPGRIVKFPMEYGLSDHTCTHRFKINEQYQFRVYKFSYTQQEGLADELKGYQYAPICHTIKKL